MKDKFFLDTNIFVYTFDDAHPEKQKKAQELIGEALSKRRGVISYQVVQEFLNVAIKKFAKPFSPIELNLYLDQVLFSLCEIYPSDEFYLFALEIKYYTHFSFYDSLIVAAALKTGCKILYSEDLQDGQNIAGLVIRNPFKKSLHEKH
jgi:predicted nucleic acid-binding protein